MVDGHGLQGFAQILFGHRHDSSDSALWAEGGHGLQLQLPCPAVRVMRITRVTANRRCHSA
jgi:hypothetical protein